MLSSTGANYRCAWSTPGPTKYYGTAPRSAFEARMLRSKHCGFPRRKRVIQRQITHNKRTIAQHHELGAKQQCIEPLSSPIWKSCSVPYTDHRLNYHLYNIFLLSPHPPFDIHSTPPRHSFIHTSELRPTRTASREAPPCPRGATVSVFNSR